MALVFLRSKSRFAHLAFSSTLLAAVVAMACDSGGTTTTAVEDTSGKSAVGCNDALLIEDFEDGDGRICDSAQSDGRRGHWLTMGDGTSSHLTPAAGTMFTPTLIPGGREGSRYAAHMTGSGFTDWGAWMGFRLNEMGSAPRPYDASNSSGVTFWMKSNVPVYLSLTIPATIPVADGGTCPGGLAGVNCYNAPSISIAPPDDSQWVEYKVPYVALNQFGKVDASGNFGFGSESFTPEALVGIQFAAPANAAFDVWVDDIRFYSCQGTECVPTCVDPGQPVACPALGGESAGCWEAGTDCSTTATEDQFFNEVWGSGPADVWAAGYSFANHAGVLMHWDGAAWSSPPSGATAILNGVWGSRPNDVWAVGDYGVALHWNGTSWTNVPTGSTQSLSKVWGSASNDVWAVGHGGTVLHWDGSTWTAVTSRTALWLSDMWGSSAGDVWSTGFAEDGSASGIIHWDGSVFSVVKGDAVPGLSALWGSGPNDVWAVGSGILHWDGTTWSDSPTGITGKAFSGIWGSAADDLWAVGRDTVTSARELVHWNGTNWSSVPPGPGLSYAVWGSGPNDIWSVGLTATIDHWDGSAWKQVPLGALP